MTEETINNTVGVSLAAAALAMLKQWGTLSPHYQGTVLEIRADMGTVSCQFNNTVRIGPGYHNHSSDWITLTGGFHDTSEISVSTITGNPYRATEILERLALFLTSDDVVNRRAGCMRRLKSITAALQ